jgi:D-alanyl-D-alanine dipeptidase
MNGKPVIAIDPGHNCNFDRGASYGKYKEDDIVLAVAKELESICKNSGVNTIWCLPDMAESVLDSLEKRVNKANGYGATIYCSIHCNADTPTDGVRGCETYAISSAGKTIATNINRELGKLGFKIRGVKETLDGGSAPFVVRMTSAIAVLVEICFLDAKGDTDVLDRVGIKAIAQAIYNGLLHGSVVDPEPYNEENDPVKPVNRSVLVDAAKWYRALPHQDAAWRSLESDLTGLQVLEFRSGYTPDSIPVAAPAPIVKPARVVTPKQPNMSVGEWIVKGDGSTNGVKGLSDRIIEQMGNVGLVKFTHPQFIPSNTTDPYFHPEAAKKLRIVLDANPHLQMQVNSAYRSPVRQLVLREFFERKINNIRAAARVGTGNHERGLAIDLKNYEIWKPILIANGWHWQGAGDPMHFDLDIDSMVPHQAIEAYQQLANQYQKAGLKEDGIWGEKTKKSMMNAPAGGW